MSCNDVLTLEDFETAKKHQTFEAEVITGHAGGTAQGALIDVATNQVTGQTQKTLPAILRDVGFRPAGFDFTTGGTLAENDRDKIVYDPVSKTWYSYKGTLPVTIAAGTNPVGNANWRPQTDPNLRDDLADSTDVAKGDAEIAVRLPVAGAAARTQHQKNMDYVSLADFAGADPTGATASSKALQAAADSCTDKAGTRGYGVALHIPGGNWVIDEDIVFNWRASSTATDGDTRRLVIFGDGAGVTFLNDKRVNPGQRPLFTFDGGEPPKQDPHLRLSLRDFRIQRPDYDFKGWGFYFKNISIMDLVNVDAQWFLNGAVFHDVIQVKIDHCQLGANAKGLIFGRLSWTSPNCILIHRTMFGANKNGAIELTNGANVNIDSCSFEGNGSDSAGNERTIMYTGGPSEGGLGMIVRNCYFENNAVAFDVAIESNSTDPGTFIIEGNTFQRTSPTRYCRGHVNLSANVQAGRHRIHLRGNTFKFLGGYTHQPNNFSVAAQTDWSEVIEEGNMYHPQQLPMYAGHTVPGYANNVICVAKVSVGNLTIVGGHNAATVVRKSPGVYRINFQKAVTSGVLVPLATIENGIGYASVSGYDTTMVEITINGSNGVASDTLNFNVVCFGVWL